MGTEFTFGSPEDGGSMRRGTGHLSSGRLRTRSPCGAMYQPPRPSPSSAPHESSSAPPQSPPPALSLCHFPCQPADNTEKCRFPGTYGHSAKHEPTPEFGKLPPNLGGRAFLQLLVSSFSLFHSFFFLSLLPHPAKCPLSDAYSIWVSPRLAPGPRAVCPNPSQVCSFTIGPHIQGGDPDSKAVGMINSKKHFLFFFNGSTLSSKRRAKSRSGETKQPNSVFLRFI